MPFSLGFGIVGCGYCDDLEKRSVGFEGWERLGTYKIKGVVTIAGSVLLALERAVYNPPW
jgi:hypothetical protein